MLVLLRLLSAVDRYLGRLRIRKAILVHEELLDDLAVDARQLLGEDGDFKDVALEAVASARDGVTDDYFRVGSDIASVAIFAIGNARAGGASGPA